jgi:hypothetical protein
MKKLMVVQCGQQKRWKHDPKLGALKADQAYTSPYFQKNIAYAKRLGDRWLILSAKYGFLDPDDLIDDYNVTFKYKFTNPISIKELRKQVLEKNLDEFEEVVVLGGEEYLAAVKSAFDGTRSIIKSPFKGLSIGSRMAEIDKALGDERIQVSYPIIKERNAMTVQLDGARITTDDIRKYVFNDLIQPAIGQGLQEITIRAGDVHSALRLISRMPMVCSALESLHKYFPVQLTRIKAPPSGRGANFFATYKL